MKKVISLYRPKLVRPVEVFAIYGGKIPRTPYLGSGWVISPLVAAQGVALNLYRPFEKYWLITEPSVNQPRIYLELACNPQPQVGSSLPKQVAMLITPQTARTANPNSLLQSRHHQRTYLINHEIGLRCAATVSSLPLHQSGAENSQIR